MRKPKPIRKPRDLWLPGYSYNSATAYRSDLLALCSIDVAELNWNDAEILAAWLMKFSKWAKKTGGWKHGG